MSLVRNGCAVTLAALAAWGCTARKATIPVPPEPWSEEGFTGRRLQTEHFDIFSTLNDAEFEAALPAFVEAAFARYQATLPTAPRPGDRLATFVLGTRSEWERFTRRRYPARAELYARIRSGGYTEGVTSVLFYTHRSATLATLAHEGWHQYVAAHVGQPIPAWLNEGLACYHEAVEWSGPEPTFSPRRNTFRVSSLREGIQGKQLMPLSQIVDTDAGEIIRRHHPGITQLYYAQAWALVTFLWHGGEGRFGKDFERLLADVSDGSYRVKLGAARLGARERSEATLGAAVFEAYFRATPAELDADYRTFLVGLTGL